MLVYQRVLFLRCRPIILLANSVLTQGLFFRSHSNETVDGYDLDLIKWDHHPMVQKHTLETSNQHQPSSTNYSSHSKFLWFIQIHFLFLHALDPQNIYLPPNKYCLNVASNWWFQPPWKIWKSDWIIIPTRKGKIKVMFQTTNQIQSCYHDFHPPISGRKKKGLSWSPSTEKLRLPPYIRISAPMVIRLRNPRNIGKDTVIHHDKPW